MGVDVCICLLEFFGIDQPSARAQTVAEQRRVAARQCRQRMSAKGYGSYTGRRAAAMSGQATSAALCAIEAAGAAAASATAVATMSRCPSGLQDEMLATPPPPPPPQIRAASSFFASVRGHAFDTLLTLPLLLIACPRSSVRPFRRRPYIRRRGHHTATPRRTRRRRTRRISLRLARCRRRCRSCF